MTENEGRCESKYTYIDKGNFGNKKKVTSKLLETFGEDLTYLKDDNDLLWDNTDPQIRKRIVPLVIDESKSWGVVKDNEGGKYQFDTSETFHGSTLFKNYIPIDKDNTSAYINTVEGVAQIPSTTQAVEKNTECQGPNTGGIAGCNAHWYVSYNRNKTYNQKAEWQNNLDSNDIPSISRKETFIPKAFANSSSTKGYLESITFNLIGSAKAEYPLIIQIFDEETSTPTELAKTEFRFDNLAQGGLVAIPFEQPPVLEVGHKYSFVLRSPLTSYANHYGIGGWGKTCNIDPYSDGESFLSENNASKFGTWIRHGRLEKSLSYHNGQQQPIDFAFQCAIRPVDLLYDTTKNYVVYFKTQQMNPCTKIILSKEDLVADGTSIVYEVSNDGKNWYALNKDNFWTKNFDEPTMFLTLRATLSTTDNTKTPKVSAIAISCTTNQSMLGYIRTGFFAPEKTPMLGASIWSGVRCPYIYSPYEKVKNDNNEQQVSVEVDVVRDTIIRDRWKLVSKLNIVPYIKEFLYDKYMIDETPIVTAGEITAINGVLENLITEEAVTTYLDDAANKNGNDEQVLEWIHKHRNVYLVSEITKFELSQLPAYPLLHVELQKASTATNEANTGSTEKSYINYKEWVDYQVGTKGTYDEPLVYFGTSENPVTLEEGDLLIEYNPLWIKGLTEFDFLQLIDEETIINEGNIDLNCIDESFIEKYPDNFLPTPFKMDVFTEYWEPADTDTEYVLQVNPMDSMREIYVVETTQETELYEDVDFSVDYETNTVTFAKPFTGSEIVVIKYTPYLTDGALGLAYRLERKTADVQAIIQPYYFQFRV